MVVSDQGRAAVLGVQRTVDAAWQRQSNLLTGLAPAHTPTPNPPPEPIPFPAWLALRWRGNTVPSLAPDPNREPRGKRTDIPENPTQDPRIEEEIRGLRRENESASNLSKKGFDVIQNPPPPPDKPRAKPDYLIEGRYFDAISPGVATGSDPVKNLASRMEEKANTQADRLVLNVMDSSIDLAQLKQHLEVNPVGSIKEVMLITKAGTMIYFYP